MKTELQDKLVEILTSIQTAAGKTADFALEQLPDIAQQYVLYARVMGTLNLTLLGIVIVLLLWGIRAYEKKSLNTEYAGVGYIFGGCTTIGLCVVWAINLQSVIFVWLAPKVWLLKELANLIK